MRSKANLQNDIKLGAIGENKILPKLENYFKEQIHKDEYRNAILDFYNNDKTLYIELKTRRMQFGAYPDVMIGKNKLDYFNSLNCNKDKNFYFVVSTYNGDYIAKINTENNYRMYEKEIFVPCDNFEKF